MHVHLTGNHLLARWSLTPRGTGQHSLRVWGPTAQCPQSPPSPTVHRVQFTVYSRQHSLHVWGPTNQCQQSPPSPTVHRVQFTVYSRQHSLHVWGPTAQSQQSPPSPTVHSVQVTSTVQQISTVNSTVPYCGANSSVSTVHPYLRYTQYSS